MNPLGASVKMGNGSVNETLKKAACFGKVHLIWQGGGGGVGGGWTKILKLEA